MGLEFLARVRRSSIWMGVCAALLAGTYAAPLHGLALAAGVLWSLINLALLESLVVAVTSPDRGSPATLRRALVGILGLPLLFGAGAILLLKLAPIWLVIGFSLPLAVIVLKAAALLLLPSVTWRRITASRWRAVLVIAAFVAAGWAMSGAIGSAQPGDPAPGQVSQHGSAPSETHGADAGAPPGHGSESTAHHGEEGPQKFANVITILARAFPNAAWAQWLHHWEVIVFSLFIAALLILVAFLATRNAQMIPGKLQNVVELLVSTLYDFVVGILGPKHGPRYVPFLGTLFIYILAMNLFGLIPFMDSPTSSLNVTVALALVVFVFSQFIGFRELGAVGYFDHLMGNPRTLIGWLLVPLMLPIHVMGELAKPISLSCRLFGNVFGEDMLLVAFATLGITTLSFAHAPFGLPLQLPFMVLALLTGTLQALVFTVLSTIYFLLMLPHDDHGHEGEAQHAH
jgi:F-type H+-transporting ATPase subunit a